MEILLLEKDVWFILWHVVFMNNWYFNKVV
jgi:hypothetical protein